MGRLIVITGRGGVGKSTFTALSARLLKSNSKLLLDLDPDGSLPEMLGIDLEEQRVRTVSEALYEIMEQVEGKGDHKVGEMLREILIKGRCLFKNKDFHLISLGTKFSPGCYCTPDEVIKSFIPELIETYDLVLIDAPAGLEHLNRKITPDVDDIFLILDPSEKSLSHIERVKSIIRGVKITYKHLFIVGNFRFKEDTEAYLKSLPDPYLGRIEFDSHVREFNLKGISLFGLSTDSKAIISIREIWKKAGFETIDV